MTRSGADAAAVGAPLAVIAMGRIQRIHYTAAAAIAAEPTLSSVPLFQCRPLDPFNPFATQ